jgi:plastocyanin
MRKMPGEEGIFMMRTARLVSTILVAVSLVGLAGGRLAAEVHQVNLDGVSFTPADLTIQVGDTVHWVWISGQHNVESGVNLIHDRNFRSGDPAFGETFDVVFDQVFLDANPMPNDQYPYYCFPHFDFGMTGLITVDSAPACGTCVGDLDDNNEVSGSDAQDFITCFLGGDPAATGCPCADMNGSGSFEMEDISLFVDRLLDAPSPECL